MIADGLVVGYVDVVGAVFVAPRGASYAQATEVHQALVLEDALAALMRRR